MLIIDIIVIALYFLVLILISVKAGKSKTSETDKLTGGRGFGLWTAAIGRTANMAGGPATMGNASYGFNSGINGIWFALSNILSMWLSAPFASRIYNTMKQGNIYTIGSYIGHRFGKFPQVFAGFTNFLAYLGFVASNLLATGTVLHIILRIEFVPAIVISMIITTLYTSIGGLKSVYLVNIFQVAIMIIGFTLILMPLSLHSVGGISNLIAQLPESHIKLDFSTILVVFSTIILPTAVTGFTTQAGFIAISSSKNVNIGWKSTILAGIIYSCIVFPILIVGATGKISMPNANSQSILTEIITEKLPIGLIGLLTAAIISATMSTAASCTMNAITCMKIDVIEAINPKITENKYFKSSLMIVAINLLALMLVLISPSIIKLLLVGYSLASGGLLIPVFATMLWKRATPKGINCSMIIGGLSFVLSQFVLSVKTPLLISLPLSLLALVVFSLLEKPQEEEIIKEYFE